MADEMPAREGRDDEVGNAEPKLRAKTLMSRRSRIRRVRARTAGSQIAMVGKDSRGCGLAWQEAVRVYRDRRNVAFQSGQSCAGVLVGVAGNGRHVIIRSATFIEGEEQGLI